MQPRFQGQVALVTGGADGLGKAIARRLASEGALLALLDRDEPALRKTAAEIQAPGAPIACRTVDVADEAGVQAAFESVAAELGRLDIMINCAGVVGPTSTRITAVTAADFDRTIAVNLRGTFLTCKYALLAMEKRQYGRILLIASIAGKEGNAGMSPYSASKAGVIGLVKSVGKEFAETGITINGLAPAVIRTAMVEGVDPAQVKYMTDKIPMKRCGTLEEVASIAAWIVSPEASFNTGFTFDLSGGRATY